MKSVKALVCGIAVLFSFAALACGESPYEDLGGFLIDIGSGSGGIVGGNGYYEDGQQVSITAVPDEGYRFVKWFHCYGGTTTYDATITETVVAGMMKGLTAYFEPLTGSKAAIRVYQSGAKGTVAITYGKTVRRGASGKAAGLWAACGKSVKVSAAAPSGYVFDRWRFDDGDCPDDFNYNRKYRQSAISYTVPYGVDEVRQTAVFVNKKYDYTPALFLNGRAANASWYMSDTGDKYEIMCESQTYSSLSVSGIPAGMRLVSDSYTDNNWTLKVTDASKFRRGCKSVVKLVAKNRSGRKCTRTLVIYHPNRTTAVDQDLLWGLDTGTSGYSMNVGIKFSSDLGIEVAEGWNLAIGGLPSGLTWNASTRKVGGVPTRSGVYVVTFKVYRGTTAYYATAFFRVYSMPTGIAGSYGGDVGTCQMLVDGDDEDEEDEEEEEEDSIGVHSLDSVVGRFAMSIASTGKISIKFNAAKRSVALSGYACSVDSGSVRVYLKSGYNGCDLTVSPFSGSFGYQVHGQVWTADGEYNVLAQRNVAKANATMKKLVARLVKFGAIQGCASGGYIDCPMCILTSNGSYPKANVTFTVNSSGYVRSAGTIAGRKLSGSALLQALDVGDYYLLYADFCDLSKSTPLVYRVIFYSDWILKSSTSARNALCEGYYRTVQTSLACKPVIYLYPESETACNVQLTLNGKLTCTYPDYGLNGWRNFTASPDGTLTFADGQQYYCLYWEGKINSTWDFSTGYCVKGSETGEFLADVLLDMGLSFREANEFIIYWLPLMQDNPYNVISFQGENYTKAAKLDVNPLPDSVLRIFMAWKPSAKPVEIAAPVIEPFERKGFTVVEWGGAKVAE